MLHQGSKAGEGARKIREQRRDSKRAAVHTHGPARPPPPYGWRQTCPPPPGRSKTRRDWLCRAARWIVGFPPRAEPHPGQTPSMSRLRGGSGPGSSATGSPWERAEHPARLAGCKPGSLSCCCRRRGSFSIKGDSRVPLKLFAPVPGCPSAGPADRSRSARRSLPAPHDAAAGQGREGLHVHRRPGLSPR